METLCEETPLEEPFGTLLWRNITHKRKTYMVWTCGKDGRKKTTKCSTAWACERRKMQRKTKEETDGQC